MTHNLFCTAGHFVHIIVHMSSFIINIIRGIILLASINELVNINNTSLHN